MPIEANHSGSPESEWLELANDPATRDLLKLREQAARQAIEIIMKTPGKDLGNQPVDDLLTDALEQSCAVGSTEQIRRLLNLQIAYCGLPREIDLAYGVIADLIGTAPKMSAEAIGKDHFGSYRALLTQTTSPDAARYAAEQIKKLRQR